VADLTMTGPSPAHHSQAIDRIHRRDTESSWVRLFCNKSTGCISGASAFDNCGMKHSRSEPCVAAKAGRFMSEMGHKRQMQSEPTGGLFPLLPKTGHINAQQQNAA